MASSFLEKKAKKQAEELERKYGSSAYGGTTWLNKQLNSKTKTADKIREKTSKKTTDKTEKIESNAPADSIAPLSLLHDNSPTGSIGYSLGTALAESLLNKTKKDEEEGKEKWYEGWFQSGSDDVSEKILGTSSDAGTDFFTGLVGMGEKAVDWLAGIAPDIARGMYYQNGGGFNIQADSAYEAAYSTNKKAAADFVEKDLYDEEAVAKEIVSRVGQAAYLSNKTQSGQFVTPEQLAYSEEMAQTYKKYIEEDMEEDSVLAHKSDSLVQSAGQLAGTAALQGVGVPWWLTTGATSWGAETENALKQGATLEEANLSGLISAGAEVLTEKISGGISFGGKTLDDAVMSELSRTISNKFVRNLAKLGTDMVGEGAEEVLSGLISNFGTALYKEENLEDILFSEEALDGYIESFLSGAALGGSGSVNTAVQSTAQGVDAVSGLTKNEDAVLQKLYQNEVAEREKSGEVSQSEKKELYDSLREDLDKGYIKVDDIESVLGGESYESYKKMLDEESSLVEQQEALKKEHDELNGLTIGERTGVQDDRLKELKTQLTDIQQKLDTSRNNPERGILKAQMDKDVYELTKNDSRLRESFFEQVRSKQKYQNDPNKYTGKGREVIQQVIDSKLADNSNQTHEFWDMVAELANNRDMDVSLASNEEILEMVKAEWEAEGRKFDPKKFEGKTVDAFYNPKDNKIVLNAKSKRAARVVMGHEITHSLEKSGHYEKMQKILLQFAESKGELQSRREERGATHENVFANDPEVQKKIDMEVTADLAGDYFFTNKDFINHLLTEDKTIFQKAWNEVKYLAKIATGNEQKRLLEQAKREYEKAWNDSKVKESNNSETKLSVSDSFNLSDLTFDDIMKMSDEELDKAWKALGYNPDLLSLDDSILLDDDFSDDFSIDSISEETGVEPEVIRILYRRKGLGDSHVEDNHKAVMTQERINQRIAEHGAKHIADYARRYITRISPKDFIDMTVLERNKSRENFDTRVRGDFDGRMGDWDYEKQLRDSEEPPVLIVNKDSGQIIGHNGRHRIRALEMAGIESVEIEVELHDEDGYLIKYNSETIPDLAISSQFDTAIETHISNVVPLNEAHRGEIEKYYGEKANSNASVKYSLSNQTETRFTPNEIQAIQSIGRKSINAFNSNDIAATEKFAQRYWEEMGTKSPFYRSWFGDWRANDVTPVQTATKQGDTRGVQKNTDTGWNIQVSGKVFSETRAHTDSYNIAARKYLPYINDIVEKAVLLDSYGVDPNKPKSHNSLLVHSLYAVADIGNGPEVLKLYVEELNNPNDSNTIKRSYQLQNIENYRPAGKSSQNTASSISPVVGNGITVADLFAYVKQLDADFVPNDSSKIVNADGTPKVMYHGSPAQFTVFDRSKAKSSGLYGRGFYFTDSTSHAGTYGNLYEVYLNIRNPLQSGGATVSRSQVRDYIEAVAENEDYSVENYGTYDVDAVLNIVMGKANTVDAFKVIQDVSATAIGDMVEAAELFNSVNGTTFDGIVVPTETVAFYPEQIKSATDNVGTFDKSNPDTQKSISNNGRTHRRLGSQYASLHDMAFDKSDAAPLRTDYSEELATLSKTESVNPVAISKTETTTEDSTAVAITPEEKQALFPDNLAPIEQEYDRLQQQKDELEARMYEAVGAEDFDTFNALTVEYEAINTRLKELDAEDPGRLNSLDDADAPPETDAQYPGEINQEVVENPFEGRDWYKVGNQKVKAYMYENPEVKPFFQEEALGLMMELNDTTKGEKWYIDDVYYESGGEKGWGGVKRNTSQSIETLLDEWRMSYADIEKGLNAIIEDNGAENIAAAKKIEFMLNDRLLNGYKDFYTNKQVPPNQDYLNLLYEKQINEYSKEAFDSFMATADQYAPAEDIAPVAAPVVETAPVAPAMQQASFFNDAQPNEAHEAIKPKPQKEPSMAKATPEEQAIAEILTEEPKVEKKKNNLWNWVKEHVLDSGMVFEDLALATGNRELQGKWNSIRYADGKAQHLMGNGTESVKSLNAIREEVEKTGKVKQFYSYLYHKHNIDRMTLETRYKDMKNKPVFGSSVTAEESQKVVDLYEAKYPAFKEFSKDVYSYMEYLRQQLVDGGVISSETAKLWAEMYPHYVPIRRAGDNGLNINVPLDSRRTGVNAPVKRAKGGNRDILPLFDTMGQRTMQTYKAIAKNRFGVELMNTLGTTIANEATSVDDVIDSVDTDEGLLQKGDKNNSATFTVFENGEKVTFEITDEMYEAMKPASFTGTSKIANNISNFRRGLLTEYNPWFMLKNAVKDIQDVLINSQHPGKTYANVPRAIKEMTTNGHWYREYMENGGEQNSYFDSQTNEFKKENKALETAKTIFGLNAISKANNIIERLPRLAEYIASRESGRSVDVSMLDAARVTTNFAAGGDLTKFLNRNGATFLNASVQGAIQQARNIREAKVNGLKGWASLAAKYVAAGLPALLLNNLIWDDDEEYEELSDYVKQDYYIVGKFGDGQFVRIPKGRTVAVIQNGFEQMQNLITGDDEADLGTFLDLLVSNLAPNNPLDNNILSPIIQVMQNKTWYGTDLVPTRLQDLPAAEQYDESTDSISRWLGETFDISPYKANYLLDQYSGVIGDTFLPMLTPEAENGDNSFLGNMIAPLKDMFTTDSVMKNQNVSDFYDLKDELAVTANSSGATEEDILMSKYLNSVNAELSELYRQKREIQNSNLSDAEKYKKVREVQQQIVDLTKAGMGGYQDISFEDDYREGGEYARVDNRVYKLNNKGEWQKLSDEQLAKYETTKAAGDSSYATDGTSHWRWYVPGEDADEDTEPGWRKITDEQLDKQKTVTKELGISPEEYWNDKEQYDYAYENPGKYAVSKAVGDFATYNAYKDVINDFDAKNEKGETVSGLKKERVKNYIFSLDLDYGQQAILFRSMYDSKDDKATYNYDIVNYLNSRDDISYKDAIAILEELGMKVDSEGNVTW